MQSTTVKNGFVRKAPAAHMHVRIGVRLRPVSALECHGPLPVEVYSILTVQLIVTTLIAAPMLGQE